jgi:xylitol oxidase
MIVVVEALHLLTIMIRKTFIQLSTIPSEALLLSPLEGWAQQEKLKNWAGNFTFSTSNVFYPDTVEQVQELVKKMDKLRPLGTRHCFNKIADSQHYLISTRELNKVIALNTEAGTVTVESGIKYGELAPWLNERGFALPNMASLPHISVAGSIATATHGSGVGNSNLSSSVTALELVIADGSMVHWSREKDREKFLAAVVGLGAFGIVTKVTLAVQPSFTIRQYVFENLPFEMLQNNFENIMSAGYSVSLFTNWETTDFNAIWIKCRNDEGSQFAGMSTYFGAKAAVQNARPIPGISAEHCTEQMGASVTWYEGLPHFKMGFTPSSGIELQSEYFVSYTNALEALQAVGTLKAKTSPHLLISEIRTIAADDLWLSPCYKQHSVAIHFTWKQDWANVMKLLPLIEAVLAPFNARPHWGKLFTISAAQLASRYEKLEEFKALVAKYDPTGKFRNDFLEKTIFGTEL